MTFTMFSQSFADEITVPFGQTIVYEELKFYFYDIEDSRCPSDVTCIWEGQVLAMIRISNATIDIGGPKNIGFVSNAFPPYSITLKDIQPYPVSTEKSNYIATLEITKETEFTDEDICGEGNILVNGICTPKKIWDSSDFRGLQTGETIANFEVAIILESLGAGLIVLFIVIYAVKKRRKNEN